MLVIGNVAINMAHVIKMEYTPAKFVAAHIDEETLEEVPDRLFKSCLKLTTTQLELEDSYGYDGAVNGTTATSKIEIFYDQDADELWGGILRHSEWI